jgi:hypothetical protein
MALTDPELTELTTRLLTIERRLSWLLFRESILGTAGGGGPDTVARVLRKTFTECAGLRTALSLAATTAPTAPGGSYTPADYQPNLP